MRRCWNRRAGALVAVAVLMGVGSGCDDLRDFRGDFRGTVIGSDDPECVSGSPCSFIRRGFPEAVVLRMDNFVPPPSELPPGTLTTEDYAAFDGDALETIVPLQHDQLSLYDFPGANRVRNYIFAVRPSGQLLAGRDATVFVSLIDNDEVEVRIIVGSGHEAAGDHFGFFRLGRR